MVSPSCIPRRSLPPLFLSLLLFPPSALDQRNLQPRLCPDNLLPTGLERAGGFLVHRHEGAQALVAVGPSPSRDAPCCTRKASVVFPSNSHHLQGVPFVRRTGKGIFKRKNTSTGINEYEAAGGKPQDLIYLLPRHTYFFHQLPHATISPSGIIQ